MATGIVLMVLGVFVLLRTVAPGQDRSLVDLIAPKTNGDGGDDKGKRDDKVNKVSTEMPDAIDDMGDALARKFPPLSPTAPPYRAPRGGRPRDNLAGHTGRR